MTMPEYDQRLMDLVDELHDRYPTVPSMKHAGVPVGALDRDDLVRLMAMLLDEWRQVQAEAADRTKHHRPRRKR